MNIFDDHSIFLYCIRRTRFQFRRGFFRMTNGDFNSAVVFGAGGGFGRFFSQRLSSAVKNIARIDISPSPGCLAGDAVNPQGEDINAALKSADLVLLCLPEDQAKRALLNLYNSLKPSCLLVITCSVMSDFSQITQAAKPNGRALPDVLLINPLFAPDLDPSGRSLAAAAAGDGAGQKAFLRLIESWGLLLVKTDPDSHDQLTALYQVSVHAAVIAVALAWSKSNIRPESTFAPPPARAIKLLAARILSGQPSTYWAIQRENPHAKGARNSLMEALKEVDAIFSGEALENFEGVREVCGALFDGDIHEQAEACAEMFRAIPNPRSQ
ncbi:prephenate dehydrogenase/arogenate dehydrogenase family protein (plasmid) [Agrobacterium tumefaciens]|uniref:prephenate dehydrogenase dimerization domain-containing protein n=1 Tax=Agrobacterium tumefaciens TaxID=358 RepID=UPI0015725AEC|nr:prephenate dehydrogenase dimerization domain-containing protein [Agrobacterium tumefaciens]NSZ87684.1 prephenate dehydrogenase/arogenate dehydrogenase family protein [Agrobacterium tumefaciens]WCA72885.1 prephenate dehydrogenase/arogenate dehydrogenase family protein [Agrobacterium tumefaciens]